ncbi:MAG TPA: bifunctional RNase H/acid phosphatase [Mycobacteriales bacterium]|jgi:probable phosphoglycerate mutase|nr:bifunctional RNase H/acid phosphatase [Mycobacteriales bacterium]
MRVVIEADGGSRGNPGPAGYGAVVRDADTGQVLREVAAGIGVASNNVAEYRGLIAGLQAALDLGASDVEVRMDSLLVVNQMSGVWKIKHEAMRPLAAEAAGLVRRLGSVRFGHVPRAQNAHADRLANEAMDDAARGQSWGQRAEVPEPEPEPGAGRSTSRTKSGTGWGAPRGTPVHAFLLRHGETPLSTERRFSGRGDPELTDKGVAQAQAAARRFAGREITAVVSSPLRRAAQTAAAVAEVVGGVVVTDDDLAETDFGDWEGHTWAEIQAQWPDALAQWLKDPSVAPPAGESFTNVFARAARARERLAAAYSGGTIVVVSHVTPIKALLREALEAPPQAVYRMHLEPASLSAIDWYDGGAGVVKLLNDTSHLGTDLLTAAP